MSSTRRRKIAALLPLLALLVTTLPFHPSTAQAEPAIAPNTTHILPAPAAVTAEDEALVRASIQHPAQNEVFYFVLPDRFENGDTSNDQGGISGGVLDHGFKPDDKGYFHGGDIAGLMAKLDYLQGLGVTALWMTPVFKNRPVQCGATVSIADCSAGYHGYWITDFTTIDPHLGTNDELKALIEEAHRRGMKVFFDIITNHTADVITYAEGQFAYRNKTDHPYRDADGNIFDDRDYAGGSTFPPLDPATSFPYTPAFRTPADASIKQPAWLNDPIYYHNRGDSTFSGESSEYGDFFGLDDLFTEHPAVVQGMIDIYKYWISEFKIDGFRIDTVKHVNMEFWQRFAPEVLAHARAEGIDDFFMYGEVFDGDPAFKSRYTTTGRLQAVLDFGFQGAATRFAATHQNTNALATFFANDDYYTDADSNAYQLPTFLGNHDLGRIGRSIQLADSDEDRQLARMRLAHALMFLARGMPVVYYGDEQGFTGDGGDKDARQDMMPSLVASYNDDNLIGTTQTTADANFDPTHPLYESISELATLRADHKALRFGAQIHRYSTDSAGIYAFSRIDRDDKIEYVVALNNAATSQSATFRTYSPATTFSAIYGASGGLSSDADGNLTVSVPAFGAVVYRAETAIPASAAAPSIQISAPADGASVQGRFPIVATLGADQLAEVTFAAKVGNGAWTPIGTDNNAPYRVFYDVSALPAGTPLSFKAIVNDLNGHLHVAQIDAEVSSGPSGGPASVTLAGSFQSELGCPGDWQPECVATQLRYDPADDVWQATFELPAGEWEYKAALNGAWDENYGAGAQRNGPNIRLNLNQPTRVKFYYDHKTHWITDNINAIIATAPGSFQSEIGCPGDWQPDCLRSWLQDPDGDGTYTFTTTAIPAGSYEAKVAINESWDLNYGQGGAQNGPNIPFDVARDGDAVTFAWNAQSKILTITVGGDECPAPAYAIIHYNRPDGDYDGWGLHLWGDAIDPSEGTTWDAPKLPNGEDDYGVFWFIKLRDASAALNFIVHKGDEKDPGPDMQFVPAQSPEVWLRSGDATIFESQAEAQGFVTIHYQRPAGDYDDWGLHLWGDAIADGVATDWNAPRQRDGIDDYGAFFRVPIKDAAQPVNFIVHKPGGDSVPDTREPGGDRSFVPLETASIWLKQGDATVYASRGAAENVVTIHYHRFDGDYGDPTSSNFNDFWGLHTWGNATDPGWNTPRKPDGQDRFGIYFRVPLTTAGATSLNYILHRGDTKDLPDDQELDLTTFGYEVWIIQGTPGYLLPVLECVPGGRPGGNLNRAGAHWVSRDTILWNVEDATSNTFRLHYDPTGAITLSNGVISGGNVLELTYDPAGPSQAIREKFPHLAGYAAFKISAADLDNVPAILKGQIAVSATSPGGVVVNATSVQIPGVLDDLYTYNGALGVSFDISDYPGYVPTIRLWAPTARSVTFHLFDDSRDDTSAATPMTYDSQTGVWSVTGDSSWYGKFYLFEVEVYVPSQRAVVRNLVTDPYSVSLAINSTRSQIINLADDGLKPAGWDDLAKPPLDAPEDITIYELHVRDFSINDPSVPEPYRGTYKAFTQNDSNGMRHLRALQRAGLTHLHLLPVFDIATVNEDKSQRREPDTTKMEEAIAADRASEIPQAEVNAVRDEDGFNWGYDPYHYTTPEGSYATDPDGATRIREFREMVQSLNQHGLRVVMDVVYNHTSAAGQDPKSVLDRIVPGYYHRLNPETGAIETSTCCPNTATEHNMMEKLMIDSLRTWATEYKVDAFRFDLMGHHMLRNMVNVRAMLDGLTPARDGVDGKAIYIYGEGWNFGEVANNARGVNATQINTAGTGIGTFNDRLRDAVRGGNPFENREDLIRNQGFSNGLYYDPNELNTRPLDQQRNELLLLSDRIRVGLAGNLRDFTFIDRNGNLVKGSEVDYNGSPTGYTLDPQEVINYVSKHDNQTLFDILAYKAPRNVTMAERVRMQNLALSIVGLGQGVPFFHAGSDMLRSKSLDRDSYNSGDWFNRLDFTYRSNNFGVGLPIADKNQENWDIMRPILRDPNLLPGQRDIMANVAGFREILEIRKSSPLFRLRTAEDISQRLRFLNTGPDQVPGMIVMALSDRVAPDLDPRYEEIMVIFNATDETQTFTYGDAPGEYMLHPVQAVSADAMVRGARFDPPSKTFTVPARTTAVFVSADDRTAPTPNPEPTTYRYLFPIIINRNN